MKKKNGFTIIEMIAALAMITIILAAVSSLVILGMKQSAINSKTLNANDASKSFFELVKNNRVDYPIGTYCIYFDNVGELKSTFNDLKDNRITGNIASLSNGAGFEEIKSANLNGKSSALKINIVKNDIDKTYEFKTISWNLNKGEFTEVNREYILAQGK